MTDRIQATDDIARLLEVRRPGQGLDPGHGGLLIVDSDEMLVRLQAALAERPVEQMRILVIHPNESSDLLLAVLRMLDRHEVAGMDLSGFDHSALHREMAEEISIQDNSIEPVYLVLMEEVVSHCLRSPEPLFVGKDFEGIPLHHQLNVHPTSPGRGNRGGKRARNRSHNR